MNLYDISYDYLLERIKDLELELAVEKRRVIHWQDLACANRKVAEDAQAQRDKALVALNAVSTDS